MIKTSTGTLDLGGVQVDQNKFPMIQQNAAQVKGRQRVLPKPVVVKVLINDHPAQALLDSGSLEDYMSSMLADQLGMKKQTLDTLLALQLVVQGSCSKINTITTVRLQYQQINEEHTFDIVNINNYNLILGTLWMHQHQVCLDFNLARILIGSDEALPLQSGEDTKLMVHSLSLQDQQVVSICEELHLYTDPICREVHEMDLPPL